MSYDFVRPPHNPARAIYDAFQAEAAKRPGRSVEEWIEAERQAVWRAACAGARERGCRPPTIEEVERCEQYACGSTDYGSKWAYGIAAAVREAIGGEKCR